MKLNNQQIKAASYDGNANNILVTAGAGCGKTRTIIARAKYLVNTATNASRILMVTFTNRAAREMKDRLNAEIGPVAEHIEVGTFHSFCLRALRNAPLSFDVEGLTIIDSDDQLTLLTLVRKRYLSRFGKEVNKVFPKPSELTHYYSYSRNTCQIPANYLAQFADLDKPYLEMCCEIFKEYQATKEAKGYLDYDDMLVRFSQTLNEKPRLKQAVTMIFDEVLVDEMQDTNPLQFQILQHFADTGVRLFCVGDPAQSIYRFRGAEFEHVYRFPEIFNNSEILKLSLNYRSYQEILDFSNWLLDRSPLNYNNMLVADRDKGFNLPIVADFNSCFDEARWIGEKVLERSEAGMPFCDAMVLVRTGRDARPIEAEFLQREIPYYFIGGTSLAKSAHVRDVLSLLRIVRNQQDDLAWMRFLTLWPRIGNKTAEKLITSLDAGEGQQSMEVLANSLGQSHPAVVTCQQAFASQHSSRTCLSTVVQALTPILKERYDRWEFRSQDLELLITVSERYRHIGDFIDAFTLEPMTSSELERPENDDAVCLITVHSAKGTEAPICFVANAGPGTYPHSRSFGDIHAEEEERRVLYVALTRAKNELFISRSTDNKSSFYMLNKPTKGEQYFLSDIPTNLVSRELYGWQPSYPKGLSSLMDVY